MFGASHFCNGVLSRRVLPQSVAVRSQLGGAALFVVWTTATWSGLPSGADLVWAAISGIGAGIGIGALYEGMRACRISVVVPVASIVSVAVPFLLSVLVLRDRVDALILSAALVLLPATWLLSRPTRPSAAGRGPDSTSRPAPAADGRSEQGSNAAAVLFGAVAGLGYAVQLFAVSRFATPEPAAPMLIGQLVSLAPLLVLLRLRSGRLVPTGGAGDVAKAASAGGLAALAMTSYLYATREVALAPAMVAIALYPALPVLLAVAVLKERLSRPQLAGLALAAVVLPLISIAG